MAPETTNERQPYIHPHKVDGTIAESRIDILLRDFDSEGLTLQKQMLEEIIAKVEPNYPKTKITLEITESYRNMHDKLMENPIGLDYLWQAAEEAGANPFWAPIRGGTDGSRLTFMGLPCPNIYAGGQNFHSNTEWISIDALELSLKTLINLVEIWTKNK
jgi:tripeptide aminopeptidase